MKIFLELIVGFTCQNGRIDNIKLSVEICCQCAFIKLIAAHPPSELVAVAEFIAAAALARYKLTGNDLFLPLLISAGHITQQTDSSGAHLVKALVNRCYGRIEYLAVFKEIKSCYENVAGHIISVSAKCDTGFHRKAVISANERVGKQFFCFTDRTNLFCDCRIFPVCVKDFLQVFFVAIICQIVFYGLKP